MPFGIANLGKDEGDKEEVLKPDKLTCKNIAVALHPPPPFS